MIKGYKILIIEISLSILAITFCMQKIDGEISLLFEIVLYQFNTRKCLVDFTLTLLSSVFRWNLGWKIIVTSRGFDFITIYQNLFPTGHQAWAILPKTCTWESTIKFTIQVIFSSETIQHTSIFTELQYFNPFTSKN